GVPPGSPQLDTCPLGERFGAERIERLVRAAELSAGVTPAPLTTQPLAIEQLGAGEIHAQASAVQALYRLAVTALGGRTVAAPPPGYGSRGPHAAAPAPAAGPRCPAPSGPPSPAGFPRPAAGHRPRAGAPRRARPPR